MFQPLQLEVGQVERRRVTKKLPIWGACDHPQRIRVREVSKNGTRREEGATQLDFKTRLTLGVRNMILE